MTISFNQLSAFDIPPFFTMEMMKQADQRKADGHEVLHLEVGQSIARTPEAAILAAEKALRDTPLNYCPALGLMSLRQAIAEHYVHAYGLEVDPNCVVVTPGSSLGLYVALLMNFNKGDKIAVAAPSYPCYRNVINSLGFTLVEIPTCSEQGYLITEENLHEFGQGIKGILIASPNNPTGSMYDESGLQKLADYCQRHGIRILSDELYHGITYDEPAQTILKYDRKATVINGFSKYFAMTGWRVGWMIVPPADVKRYENLLQNIILCSSTLTQQAATKAFSAYQELDAHVAMYKTNLDVLYHGLYEAGLTNIYKPSGAFYLYVELPDIKQNSMDFCKELLRELGVATAPGLDFSTHLTTCAIRLSFCQSTAVVTEAARRLHTYFKNR